MNNSFAKFAGWMALLAGMSGFLYSISFIVLQNNLLSALFLMLGGIFSAAALTGLYERLGGTNGFALLGLLLVLGAALGSAIHGGYDLSNTLHPPASLNPDLPNPVDPRGLLTFGIAGLGLFLLSRLMTQARDLPSGLAYLGLLSAILMIILYLGRLIVLQATSPVIVIPALLEGFLVNPIWYLWLGLTLMREPRAAR